jgi:hypothetical protein
MKPVSPDIIEIIFQKYLTAEPMRAQV